MKLTAERYAKLMNVNRAVNASIRPEPNLMGVAGEEWIINPSRGDCNDYAVSKRHALRQQGWPERSMFLSEVVTVGGEHHLVLVVRTDKGDLILDSLTGAIKPVNLGRYQWVRAQHPGNPMAWHEIAPQAVNV
jgi:predicted transglutaminase-like cysteine proteinase